MFEFTKHAYHADFNFKLLELIAFLDFSGIGILLTKLDKCSNEFSKTKNSLLSFNLICSKQFVYLSLKRVNELQLFSKQFHNLPLHSHVR